MLLTPKQTRQLVGHALANRYAVLAVNADSPAAVVDCLLAAREADAPIIIETSLWQLTGHSFGVGDPLLGIDQYLSFLRTLADSPRFRRVPVAYHTDHIKGPDTVAILQHALRSVASSVSLDSSDLTDEQNIELMSQLCSFAEQRNLDATLEMEVGVDEGVTPLDVTESLFGEIERRHPGFLALWAPGVGTKHGLDNDMTGFSPQAISDHQELASDLAQRPIGIALHGSSGLSDDQLQAAVGAGVTKVNWSSESLLIRSQALRQYCDDYAGDFERSSPAWKNTVMDNGPQSHISAAYLPTVIKRLKILNSHNQATPFTKTRLT